MIHGVFHAIGMLCLAFGMMMTPGGLSNTQTTHRQHRPAVLLVADKEDRSISILDAEAGKQIAQIPTGGTTAHEVAASPDGRLAYAPIYGNSGVGKPGTDGSTIAVIDLAEHKVVGHVDFGRGVRPHFPIFDAKRNLLYVTTELDKSVSIIDPKTLTIVGSIPTEQEQSHMLALSSDGSFGYTANVGPGTVSVLDMVHRKTLAVIPVATGVQRISVSKDDRLVFTSDTAQPRLAVIDADTRRVREWIQLPALGYGTAPTVDGHWLLVAIPSDNKVAVVDLQAMKVAHMIDVCDNPQEIVTRPDNRSVAYVSCMGSAQVGVLDLANWKMQKAIEAGKDADGMTWVPGS